MGLQQINANRSDQARNHGETKEHDAPRNINDDTEKQSVSSGRAETLDDRPAQMNFDEF